MRSCFLWWVRRTAPIRGAWWKSARRLGVPSYLVDDVSEVGPSGWTSRQTRGGDGRRLGAGESGGGAGRVAPGFGFRKVEEVEIKEEDVRFNLPGELRRPSAAPHHCDARMSPRLQIGECSDWHAVREAMRHGAPTPAARCRRAKATGGRI